MLGESSDEAFPAASENVNLLVGNVSSKVEGDVTEGWMSFGTSFDECLKEGEVRRVWSSEMEETEFGKKEEELSEVVACYAEVETFELVQMSE